MISPKRGNLALALRGVVDGQHPNYAIEQTFLAAFHLIRFGQFTTRPTSFPIAVAQSFQVQPSRSAEDPTLVDRQATSVLFSYAFKFGATVLLTARKHHGVVILPKKMFEKINEGRSSETNST